MLEANIPTVRCGALKSVESGLRTAFRDLTSEDHPQKGLAW